MAIGVESIGISLSASKRSPLSKNVSGDINITSHTATWIAIRVFLYEFMALSLFFLYFDHSYLRASMGSSCAAFFAGYQPKNTPVKVHTAKLMTILHGCMYIGQWAMRLMAYDEPTPISTPMIPPVTLSSIASMKNLRNQVNPHFLLNTLNNIYALTAFNQQGAQKAILELSGMLRHILYDNQQDFVRLDDEIKFIHSYVNLMRIRIPKTTKIQIDVDVPKDTELRIAPLIFISLIENAFKHGIGTAENSFIHINIYADRKHISCEIENSNFPKNDTDRSGHGIGLEQVGKRLELAYHKKYTWEKGTKDNNKIYYSNIYIYDTKLRNN